MQAQHEVKLDRWMKEGFDLYKENFGLLVVASLVVVLLSGVTAGILAGPMFGGLIIVCLALWDRKSPRPQVGTVFQGFGYFVQTLLMFLVWFAILIIPVVILSIIPVIGQIAVMALALAVQAFLMFAVFLIVERNMGFWEASMESIHTVLGNLWPFLGFGALAAVIGNIGSFVCGIGAIFTIPIQYCMLTAAYRDIYGQGSYGSDFGSPPPIRDLDPEDDDFEVDDDDYGDSSDDDSSSDD